MCEVGINWSLFSIGINRMIQQYVKHLAVMYRRTGHCIDLYQLIVFVGIDMVFVVAVLL